MASQKFKNNTERVEELRIAMVEAQRQLIQAIQDRDWPAVGHAHAYIRTVLIYFDMNEKFATRTEPIRIA